MNKRFISKIPIMDADQSLIEIAKRLDDSTVEYIMVGRIAEEKDKRILLLYFFKRSELKSGNTKAEFRTFICDDYITQNLNCQPLKWRISSLDNIVSCSYSGGQWFSWKERVFIADEETVKSIQEVLPGKETPLAAIEKFQTQVKADRLAKKHKIITDAIDKKMALIGELPEDFKDWLHHTAFASMRYIFYEYTKSRKRKKGYCEACRSAVEIEKPRHRQKGVCPVCKADVTYIVSGRVKSIEDIIDVDVMQKIPNGFVVRHFIINRIFAKQEPKGEQSLPGGLTTIYVPEYGFFEKYRDFYEGGERTEYYFGKFKATEQIRWCENNTQYISKPGVLYEKNIGECIAGTAWEYCAIKQYATHHKGFIFSVWRYLEKYKSKKYIEYLVKLQLYELTKECISGAYTHLINDNGKNLTEILGVKKQYVKLLQELNANEDTLEVVQELSKINYHATSDFVLELVDKFDVYEAHNVAKMLKYVSYQKLLNYLSKRITADDDLNDVFITWKDYIENCEKLGYDLKSDFILFPKHLKRNHDVVLKRVRAKEGKERAVRLGEKSRGLVDYFADLQRRYSFETDGYIIIAPKNLNDVVKEGHKLRHCVDGYADSVGDKKRIILFLRKSACADTPFYTIEVAGNVVQQCRGLRNCAMTDEVKSVIEIYKKSVLSKLKKPVKARKRA